MTEHELKTWPEYFQAIVENRKPFEYRLNDRNYQVGDVLFLREWVPPTVEVEPWAPKGTEAGYYTGRELRKSVTYMLDDKIGPTMREGFVVMGLGEIEPQPCVVIDIDRELIERNGLDAKLPAHFSWGADAMVQFEFGKRRAVEAILALIDARA